MKVNVVKVEPSNVPLTGEWVGTLDGYVNAQIQPQANGYLIRQDYREGTQVEKGQVLFEIDPRPFEAALEQAQGQLGQAQAQLALAKINVKRDTPLSEAHAIARSQLDNEIQQEAQAKATVETAEAAVTTANLNLGFTKVRSLITGVAGQATTQVGNLVNTQSVLTAVSQLNPIKVYFSISDSEYLALTRRADGSGSDLLHGASKLPLTLTLSDGEVYPYKGHVVFVDRQLNTQTGAIRIAAAFPNPGNVLRPGQFGRVKAETGVLHNAVLVPQVAITEFQGQEQVYTVGKDNKVHANNVTLGPQYGNSCCSQKRTCRWISRDYRQSSEAPRRRTGRSTAHDLSGGRGHSVKSTGGKLNHVEVLHSPPHRCDCHRHHYGCGWHRLAAHAANFAVSRTSFRRRFS